MNSRMLILVAAVLAAGAVQANVTAITGATVHTEGPAGKLENATVLIEGGRILAVGADVVIPDGAVRVDGSGKIVTPGLFSPLGEIGLTEVDGVSGTVDYVQRGDEFSAAFDVADAYNPRSTLIPINRVEGITRAATLPAASWRA